MSVSSLLMDESPIVIQPSLGKALGVNNAIVLQQLNYWLTNSKTGTWHEGRKWIYNSLPEWVDQLPLTLGQVRRAIKELEDRRIVLSCQPHSGSGDMTKWYTIDRVALEADPAYQQALARIEERRSQRSAESDRWGVASDRWGVAASRSYTKIPSEIPSEKKPLAADAAAAPSAPSKPKASRVGSDHDRLTALLGVWNENRGTLGRAVSLNASRTKGLRKLIDLYGEEAERMLTLAAKQVAELEVYRTNRYGLDELLAGEKFVKYAERALSAAEQVSKAPAEEAGYSGPTYDIGVASRASEALERLSFWLSKGGTPHSGEAPVWIGLIRRHEPTLEKAKQALDPELFS